jgi:hypothetical protein
MLRFRKSQRHFFETFEGMARGSVEAAGVLAEMFRNGRESYDTYAGRIKDIEHRCDHLVHELVRALNRTFITPFDREDLYALASSLDNVMDAIDHAASLLRLYRIQDIRPGARELAHTVSASAERLHTLLDALAAKQPVQPHAVEINRLENEADRAYQEAVRALFDGETDPIVILKWKELLDVLEQVTDCCEDVANVIEGVAVKHG